MDNKIIALPKGTVDMIVAASARAEELKQEFQFLERAVQIAISTVLDTMGITGNYKISEDKRSLVLVTENQGG